MSSGRPSLSHEIEAKNNRKNKLKQKNSMTCDYCSLTPSIDVYHTNHTVTLRTPDKALCISLTITTADDSLIELINSLI